MPGVDLRAAPGSGAGTGRVGADASGTAPSGSAPEPDGLPSAIAGSSEDCPLAPISTISDGRLGRDAGQPGHAEVSEVVPSTLQTGRAYTPPGRDFRSPQQRSSVEQNPNGGTSLVLDEGEEVSVSVVNGETVITISDESESSNLGGSNGRGRSLGTKTDRMTMSPARPRTIEKMAVSVADDGRLVVTATEGSTLHLVGDPTSGSVSIIELPEDSDLPEPVLAPTPLPAP